MPQAALYPTVMRTVRPRLIICPDVWLIAEWMMPFLFTNGLPHLHCQAGFVGLVHLAPHSHMYTITGEPKPLADALSTEDPCKVFDIAYSSLGSRKR